jgi:hypothetical protein
MVSIVERREDAPSDSHALELKVYLSRKDRKTVLGYVRPFGVIVTKGTAVWLGTPFGVPAGDAFRTALEFCETHGMSALWVHDPDNRFPPAMRPNRSLRGNEPEAHPI